MSLKIKETWSTEILASLTTIYSPFKISIPVCVECGMSVFWPANTVCSRHESKQTNWTNRDNV